VTSHLWQSTLFALAAALFDGLAEAKPGATRYSIWFIGFGEVPHPIFRLIRDGQPLGISPRTARAASGLSYIAQRINRPRSHRGESEPG